ncbi:adenylate/guanylate cyclase domain-containing protein [Mariprofundus sp. EBB-1]|uniref:adenylate/guanylate cyclase domain-containing protein n=1 Tax=Mariprofundus sp. EBB-1 TaxID=2650971 RepID=UPI000EF1A434|nr:adenylate/guanylate cyclase domain-containing protein [Mariprofundus sp. EBB-1]RLL50549.1 adenylate/guanylate cyclase domain-containing protein [Mariprofundus sp. EBB-1]
MEKSLMDVMNDYLNQGIDPTSREAEIWREFGKRFAILVIDSTGFTRTTNEFGIIYFLSKLAQKRNITIPIIQAYDCETYITEADSLIALFPNVKSAFNAVLEISDALKQKKLMLTPDEPFRICAGIGYGDLLVTGEHGAFFGPEMNMASKLGEDTADADELMLTDSAYAELDAKAQLSFKKGSSHASGNDIPYHIMQM